MYKKVIGLLLVVLAFMAIMSCELQTPEVKVVEEETVFAPEWSAWMASEVVKNEDGSFMIEGDIAVDSMDDVQMYYNAMANPGGKSTVYMNGSSWSRWSTTQRIDLRYCISNGFGTDKADIIDAMAEAAANWENYANVEFIYRADQDSNCTASNKNIVFIVRPATSAEEKNNTSAAASAFYPHKYSKELIVYDGCYEASYNNQVKILTHELGHVLGLMHEHIWKKNKDGSYSQVEETYDTGSLLTAYDTNSIMFYSSKPGFTGDGTISRLDVDGIQRLYGKNPARYSVFVNKSTAAEKYVYNFDWEAYQRRHSEYYAAGYRVYKINAFVQNGQAKYSAIFRKSTADELGYYGWTRADFLAKYNELNGKGWRLYAVDAFVLNGTELYAGVFRPSTVEETGILGWKRADFLNKYNTLRSQGWRIHTISTFVLNGTELHTVFFRKSTAAEEGVYGWSRADFITKYDDLKAKGYRISKMDTYRLNGTELYTGIFTKSTTGQSWVMGYEFDDFERRYEDNYYPNGYRLTMQSVF